MTLPEPRSVTAPTAPAPTQNGVQESIEKMMNKSFPDDVGISVEDYQSYRTRSNLNAIPMYDTSKPITKSCFPPHSTTGCHGPSHSYGHSPIAPITPIHYVERESTLPSIISPFRGSAHSTEQYSIIDEIADNYDELLGDHKQRAKINYLEGEVSRLKEQVQTLVRRPPPTFHGDLRVGPLSAQMQLQDIRLPRGMGDSYRTTRPTSRIHSLNIGRSNLERLKQIDGQNLNGESSCVIL